MLWIKVKRKKNRSRKTLVLGLEFLILAVAAYLIFLPLYPLLKFHYLNWRQPGGSLTLALAADEAQKIIGKLPVAQDRENLNRIIIAKIGVNAPIIESMNSEDALSRGAWHMPESGTPPTGGNTVVTAHRFKYLPPNNLTFYLLDKLAAGDIVSLRWEEKIYYYKVREKKIVGADDQSILASSDQPILTLFTCDPIWSEARRLVIAADLMK